MKKSFCIVCLANYCRSPVVENLLKNKFKNDYEFFSAGISPISQPGMDPRSLKFLEENNISYNLHTPKNISKKMLNYFDKFLAVDLYVLNQLNITYPKYKNKFLPLNIQSREINIVDPYLLSADQYERIMNDINYVVDRINLEDI